MNRTEDQHRAQSALASATAERHDDGVHVGQVFQNLQRDRAVTGDHAVVVEGMDEGGALGVEGVAPYVTPNPEFYRIDTALLVPRPNVDTERPDIRIHLHLDRENATLSLDLAGDSLHRRGYRREGVEAPLKENLAAALLVRAGWQQLSSEQRPLVDGFCGSGTLVIEAALMALGLDAVFIRIIAAASAAATARSTS